MSTKQINQTIADKMVDKAILYCAEKNFAGDTQRARSALQQGRCDICGHVSDSLGRQIGEYLGGIDKSVKAVYKYDPERTPYPSQIKNGTPIRRGGINLVAWVDRKSPVLTTLGTTLESVLADSQRKIGCKNATPACYTLDLQLVDDEDVAEHRGYGVITDSMYMRSTRVWTRGEIFKPTAPMKPSLHGRDKPGALASIDLKRAPESALLDQAFAIERLPADERTSLEQRLRKIKAALIHKIISDQQAYIDIAQEWFTTSDLSKIHQHKIGYGRIGGKAAGFMLAARILKEVAEDDIQACIRFPESYFLGSDLIYIFMAMNGLMHWNNQKYKPEEQIRAEYPQIKAEFQAGEFPPEELLELQKILDEIGPKPLIVRSSSQLEDNFGTSFAGKYDSFFCPNQGTPEENLAALTNAIARTYASTLKPEALLYRRSKELQDYDERMAVIIQAVQGEQFGRYYLPLAAGVAFSHNLYRWSPEIRREDGFARLVWGLGTRAVQRVGDNYPRLVALSHPTLQPDDSAEAIRRYSQHYVDLIDLEDNQFKTLPIQEVLNSRYPPLRYLAQIEQEGYFVTPRTRVSKDDLPKLVITYEEFLRRTPAAELLSKILRLIESNYHASVDMEFTIHIPNPRDLHPQVQISILQCRPQSHLQDTDAAQLPEDLSSEDIIFSTQFMVPQGYLPKIRHVLFVKPEAYYALPTPDERREVGMAISRLNAKLGEKTFICVGPGRWGTLNPDLGVFVSYSEIHNAGALVELSGKGLGPAPEPSLGTHFFQDLMEANIYPLVIRMEDEEAHFNREFFYQTPNCLTDWVEAGENLAKCLHLIDVTSFRPGHHLELLMDDEKMEAIAYLAPDS